MCKVLLSTAVDKAARELVPLMRTVETRIWEASVRQFFVERGAVMDDEQTVPTDVVRVCTGSSTLGRQSVRRMSVRRT